LVLLPFAHEVAAQGAGDELAERRLQVARDDLVVVDVEMLKRLFLSKGG
jgi:hypothetical protein